MFSPDDVTEDAFLGGCVQLLQPRQGYRAATDPVLLAASVAAKAGQSVLDIGCGVGTAVLCLGARVPGLDLTGLELQADYADLARQNATRNDQMLKVVTGDVTDLPPEVKRSFDHVISNPPYYAADGTPSPIAGRDIANRSLVPLQDWVEIASRRVRPEGWLTLILAADALPQALQGLGDTMGSVAVLPLAARPGRAAGRVIIQARKGGKARFRLLAPVILHDALHHDSDRISHSPIAQTVLRDGGDLLAQFR